jgi:hypothetical protein
MKPTDLSMLVTSFLTHHLAAQRNLSCYVPGYLGSGVSRYSR